MGRAFIRTVEGKDVFVCMRCNTSLTNNEHLIDTNYRSSTGEAYLFKTVFNIRTGRRRFTKMITGDYIVNNVYCKLCNTRLGWRYEYSVVHDMKNKEGKIVLEIAQLAVIREVNNA